MGMGVTITVKNVDANGPFTLTAERSDRTTITLTVKRKESTETLRLYEEQWKRLLMAGKAL